MKIEADMKPVSEPMVVVTESPRAVQVWQRMRWAGLEQMWCVASMSEAKGAPALTVSAVASREIQDQAIALFTLWRDGLPVQATHTVSWGRGEHSVTVPIFEEVTS